MRARWRLEEDPKWPRTPVPKRKRYRARLSSGDEESASRAEPRGPVSSLRRTRASKAFSFIRSSVRPSVARYGNTNYKAYSTGAFREMTGIESSPAAFGAAPARSLARSASRLFSSIYDRNTEDAAAILGLVSPSTTRPPPLFFFFFFSSSCPFLSLPRWSLPWYLASR